MRNFTITFIQLTGILAVASLLCCIPQLFDIPAFVHEYIGGLGTIGFTILVVSTLLHLTAVVTVLPAFPLPGKYTRGHIAIGLLFTLVAAIIGTVGVVWSLSANAYHAPVEAFVCVLCGMYGAMYGVWLLCVFGGRLCIVGFGRLGNALWDTADVMIKHLRALLHRLSRVAH